MDNGFFEEFKNKVRELIILQFQDYQIEVKHIRKELEISNKDRSGIIFISRSLAELEKEGFLEKVFSKELRPKKYRRKI